ncbi:MAG TPA: ATP-binding protein, partial [Mycobacterium sp.]|nr:ATP-binding protein [Mycobacterium sp.]
MSGPPLDSQRYLFLGTLLQFALRILLIAFIATTLLFEPPNASNWICVAVLVGYVVVVAGWSVWALRPAVLVRSRRLVTLLVLTADVTVVSVLSVLTGITSPDNWTSDVLRNGLFLIPLIAAAQLDPYISGAMAVPTLSAFVTVGWINKGPNEEPWASIVLSAAVLAGLAIGSVALSRIQQSKVETIGQLAQQRTQLLEEVLALEKRERQALSERLHDGALQYVLVARQDLDEARSGSDVAMDRVDSSLVEVSQLLRNVVRELHPEVLARTGLKSAVGALADNVASRADLTVDLDTRAWPENLRTDADHLLYSAVREIATNAIKHAQADRIRIALGHEAGTALLRITDDGVGISPTALVDSVENGHIGLASIR